MKNKKAPLCADAIYHIYNRANGSESLFVSDKNYLFFLQKYALYADTIADTLCYCLMPNHFHFLVRIKSEEKLKVVFNKQVISKTKNTANPQGFENLEGLISKRFGSFFNAYAKAFNKQNNRKGSLFMHPYKRKQVNDETYLRKLVHYIHYNPIEAGLTDDFDWKYCSYPAIISERKTKIAREEVVGYFGDLENFKYCHKYPPEITGIDDI